MFGDMEEKQKMLQQKLGQMEVSASAGDGAVKVVATADRKIVNIAIDKAAIDLEDMEQLEDILLVAVNRAIALAAEKETEETQKLIQDMLPPGMGGLTDLFQ